MTKLFAEKTIAEKFAEIAAALVTAGVEGASEYAEFLDGRAEKQVKANKSERKASKDSAKLKDAVLDALTATGRATADTVLEKLEEVGYTDESKVGLTVARVRAALSALAKDEVIYKFDADRRKAAVFTKVSYSIDAEVEAEAEVTADEAAE